MTMQEKKQLSLKEIQNIELELLLSFDNICKNQGLRYSLGGGSLLGAIRHKGFIPWDDDIDVIMPRPDYELFLQHCYEHDDELGFKLITYDTIKGYNRLFAKIWDPSTLIIDDVMDVDYDLGVNIDIFPIEGLGDSEKEALTIFKKTLWYRELLNATHWKKYFRSKTHSILVEPIRFAMFFLSRFVNPKKLLYEVDKENRRHPFEQSQYAGCVCGSYREKEIMQTETFKNYTELEFEGRMFKTICNYDEYLRKHYGEYMKMPSEEERTTHHTYKAYDR